MLIALALLICWPIAELLVALQVAGAIGAIATVVLMFAAWPVGTWVLRTHGAAAWRRLIDTVAAGRSPAREVVDGALVVIGAVLLIVPGFLTDALGAFLLLPPTRALLRPLLVRGVRHRPFVRAAAGRGVSYDVDSTASDIDPPQLRS